METTQKPAAKHWSVHPWKLTAVVIVLLNLGLPVAVAIAGTVLLILSLLLVLLLDNVAGAPLAPDIWGKLMLGVLFLLALAAGVLMTRLVLRVQERHGLEDRAQNRVSWTALPGLLVALALALPGLLQPLPEKTDTAGLLALFSSMAMPVSAGLMALKVSLLLPVWRRQASLIGSALILAAVDFALSLLLQAVDMISGKDASLFPWILTSPAISVASALVAVALFVAVGRRLWDAVALLAALECVQGKLCVLWAGADTAALNGQGSMHALILWVIPALLALYCLRRWDREASSEKPIAPAPIA